MKVDKDPLQIDDTNFAEPVDINMVDAVEVEGGQLDADKISKDTQGQKTVEGLMGQEEGNATNGNAKIVGNAKVAGKDKITEGLRVRFKELEIAEGPKFEVNMVDLNQLSVEIAEIERRLKMENDRMQTGHQN